MMIAQKISYNIIFVGTSKLISIGIALFAIGLLSRYLGTAGFGQYILALSYLGLLMALADMGLHAITTREISRDGANENEIINKVFTLRVLLTGAIFVLATAMIALSPIVQQEKNAIFVVVGAFFFSSTYSLLNAVFQKHLSMDRVAIAELCGKCVQMGTILALVKLELPFIFSVIAVFLAMVTNFVLIVSFARRYIKITFDWDVAYWKDFLRKSYPLGISAVATFLYFKVNAIILSQYQPMEAVGIYGAAYKIIETIIFFPAMVIGLVLPLLSRYIFSDQMLFDKTVNATVKFFVVILIPLLSGLYFLAPEAIGLINGPGFENAVGVLQILVFSLIGIFFGHLFMSTAIAANLQNLLTKILVMTAVLNVALNFYLIPRFSYVGAAASSVITEFFVMGVVYFMLRKKTDFILRLQKPFLYLVALGIIIVINVAIPINAFAAAFLGVIAYGAFILWAKLITLEDLKSIKPSTR